LKAGYNKRVLPNGPTRSTLMGSIRFARQPYAHLKRCAATYGEPFTLPMPSGNRLVFFSDPAANKIILSDPGEHFVNGEVSRRMFQDFVGASSLLVIDGKKHIRHRQLMLPPFHGERMRAYGQQIQRASETVLARVPRNKPIALERAFQEISLEVIIHAVFGVEDPARVAQFRHAIVDLIDRLTGRLMFVQSRRSFFGLSAWDRFRRGARKLDELVYAQIAERRGHAGEDILSMLLSAKDEAGEPLSDQELRDELLTMLLVGHETTATSLTWAAHNWSREPEVLAKVVDELGKQADPEAIAKLPYFDAACRESLRKTPVIPAILRTVARDTEVCGVALPKGCYAGVALYLTHHSPTLYEEPERFRPERFLDRKYSPFEFLPFGGGIRRCIGNSFALYEMKIALAALLRQAKLSAAPGQPERAIRRKATIAPDRGGRVVLA
jgi:cytochrome P450